MEPLEITVHPGIGDISWVYSKLVSCGRPLRLRIAEDRKTKRSLPYVDLLPNVESAEYGDMGDYIPLSKSWNAYYGEFMEAEAEGKELMISANNWLEKGNRLEGYMPDLETDFHYEITTSPRDLDDAVHMLPAGKKVGIYTSSMGGAVGWNGWEREEWTDFGRRLHKDYPGVTVVLMGAKWDIDLSGLVAGGLAHYGVPYVNLCGRTPMPLAVEILKQLDWFVGFASGMGVLSNVLWKPCCMLYPDHLVKLMDAWPCPVTLATGYYKGLLWQRPADVLRECRPDLDRFLET